MTTSSKEKTCTKCGEIKPANRKYFGSTPKGNLRNVCRACINTRSKAYAEANPESVRRRARKRQQQVNGFAPSDSLKKELFSKQESICPLCGCSMPEESLLDPTVLQVEHLIPVCRGGTNDKENLVLAHRPCNQEKASKTMAEYLEWRKKVGLPLPHVF